MSHTPLPDLAKRCRDKARVLLAGVDGDSPYVQRMREAADMLQEASIAIDHADTVLKSVPETVRFNRDTAGISVMLTVASELERVAASIAAGKEGFVTAQEALARFANQVRLAVRKRHAVENANAAKAKGAKIELVRN